MLRRFAVICALPAALFLMLTAPAGEAAEVVVKVGGSGISLGPVRALAKAFEKSNPGIKVVVPPSIGSKGAIKAVSHKALDIGILARPLNDDETGLGLIVDHFAKTPMIVITSRDVGVKDISIRDIIKIYRGDKTKWPDGKIIRVPIRPAGETSVLILRNLSPEMDQALDIAIGRGLFMAYSDQDNENFVEKNSGAISFSALSLVLAEKSRVKILRLDGVKPSIRNITKGSYPLSYPLFIVTNKDISVGTGEFLDFMRSPKGKKILAQNGIMVVAK